MKLNDQCSSEGKLQSSLCESSHDLENIEGLVSNLSSSDERYFQIYIITLSQMKRVFSNVLMKCVTHQA